VKRRALLQSAAMAMATTAAARLAGGDEVSAEGAAGTRRRAASAAPAAVVLLGSKDGKIVAMQADKEASVNKGLLLRQGLPRRPHPLRPGPPDRAAEAGRWQAGADLVGGGDRHHPRPHRRRAGHEFAMYGSGQWTIPEGYAANKFVKGGPGPQPHRSQRPPVHGLRRRRVQRHLRRRRAGRLLRRPRPLHRADRLGETTRPRCIRCCSRASWTAASRATRSSTST
jgi:hypothetical protein